MKKLILLVLVAACGGGSSTKPATSPDPMPVAEPAVQPADPKPDPVAEPEKPAEPPPPDPAQVKADLLAAETAAFEKAKPVFEKNCARCHTKGNKGASKKKLAAFDMGTYPLAGKHAKDMSKEIREVLGIGGGKPKMPADKKGAVKGDDLALIAAWADAFDASHAGGAHEDHAGH